MARNVISILAALITPPAPVDSTLVFSARVAQR